VEVDHSKNGYPFWSQLLPTHKESVVTPNARRKTVKVACSQALPLRLSSRAGAVELSVKKIASQQAEIGQ
jgi:hypothetical protein